MRRKVTQSQTHTNRSSIVWSLRALGSLLLLPSASLPLHLTPRPWHITHRPICKTCCSQIWHALSGPCGSDYILHPLPHMSFTAVSSEILPMPQCPAQMSTLPGSLPFIPLIRTNHFSFAFSLHTVYSFTFVFISLHYNITIIFELNINLCLHVTCMNYKLLEGRKHAFLLLILSN